MFRKSRAIYRQDSASAEQLLARIAHHMPRFYTPAPHAYCTRMPSIRGLDRCASFRCATRVGLICRDRAHLWTTVRDHTLATVEEERELVVKLTTEIRRGREAGGGRGRPRHGRSPQGPTETVVYITDKGKKA